MSTLKMATWKSACWNAQARWWSTATRSPGSRWGRSSLSTCSTGWPEVPEGFYEVIRDGSVPLLRQVKKILRFDNSGSGLVRTGDDNDIVDGTIPYFFQREETLYMLENGNLRKIRPRTLKKQLAKPAGDPILPIREITWHPAQDLDENSDYRVEITAPGYSGRFKAVAEGFTEEGTPVFREFSFEVE